MVKSQAPLSPPPWGEPRSTPKLAQDCAQYTSHQRPPPPGPDPCYELFCRAFAHPPDQDACQRVFFRFWKAQQNAEPFRSRFPNTKTVMGFLRRCAASVRIETHRQGEKQRLLTERLRDAARAELVLARARLDWDADDFDLKQVLLSRLKGEREQVVFVASYQYGLPPREIQAQYPDLFPDTKIVHRVKENLLKRLRRDPELRDWWTG